MEGTKKRRSERDRESVYVDEWMQPGKTAGSMEYSMECFVWNIRID